MIIVTRLAVAATMAVMAAMPAPLAAQTPARPLLVEGKQSVYQRVLTRPGAERFQAVDAAPEDAYPAFQPLYVYGEQAGWYQVGRSISSGPEAWVKADEVVDWKQNIVAAFTNPAGRQRQVLFETENQLRALMEHTGETANLGILNGDAVLFVSQAETHETIRAFFPPGTRSPLHASGIGKALLAFGRADTLRMLLDHVPLKRFTDRTLTTAEALQEDLSRIRHRGFSFDDEEKTRGMRCIAAPVFDLTGEAVAGISVSGPSHRIGHEHVKTLGAAVAAAAGELSQALGGQG